MAGQVLDLAVVGCGRVFQRYHLPAILASRPGTGHGGVRLVAACEVDPSRREWAQATLGVPCADSLEGLLATSPVRAALVCTPPETHAGIARLLLGAGVHVLLEKPMAMSVEEATAVSAAWRASGAVLRVGFNRRYRPAYAELMRRALANGGARDASFTFVADGTRWGGSGDEGAPSSEYLLHDAGSHALDLIAHLAGPIEAVRAATSEGDGAFLVDVEARLRDGVTATCSVGRATRYREVLKATDGRGRRLVSDASGHSALGRLRINLELVRRRVTGRPSPSLESFQAQLAAFAAACLGAGDAIGAGPQDGLMAVAAVEACLRSLAQEGTWSNVANTATEARELS